MDSFESIPVKSQKEEANDGAELRMSKAEKLIRLMNVARNINTFNGKKTNEVLANEGERRQFILDLSFEQYLELIEGVNGILRSRPKAEWGADGEKVAMMGGHGAVWDFPEHEDKFELLKKSLELAQKMLHGGRSVQDVAILLSTTVTATHLFNDGNGRTSRFVLVTTSKGTSDDGKGLLQQVLSSRDDAYSNLTDAGFLQPEITDLLEQEIGARRYENGARIDVDFVDKWGSAATEKMVRGDLVFSNTLSEEKKKEFLEKLKDSWLFMSQAMFRWKKPELEMIQDEDGNIPIDAFTSTLTDPDVDAILGLWKEQKKKHVEILMDCIANPEKKEYQTVRKLRGEETKREVSFLDLYKDRVRQHTDEHLYQELLGGK